MNEKLKILGQAVRAVAYSRVSTVWLSDYEASNDTYNGFAVTVGKSLGGTDPKLQQRGVKGLRPYPYAANPKADFQFIMPGEDESPLNDIALASTPGQQPSGVEQPVDADGQPTGPIVSGQPVAGPELAPPTPIYHPADENHTGEIGQKEADKYFKKTGQRVRVGPYDTSTGIA